MKFRTEGLIIKEQNIGEQDKLVFALTKSCLLYTSDAADE